MTIVIPKPGFVDKLLRLLGKQRGVTLQRETPDASGTQIYFVPKKESALKAILRPNTKALPAGMADIFTFQDHDKIAEEEESARTRMPSTPASFILQHIPMSGSNRQSVS
jgi:hypothetical protein